MLKQISAVAVAVLLLAGCAPQTPATPTPTATSSSPSPTPTPTPTPTPDFSDPAAWVVGYGSVGPLVVGGSLAAAEPYFGTLAFSRQEPCPWFVILENSELTIWVMTSQADDDLIEQVVLGDSGAPDPAEVQLRTAAGLSVGSSLADVVAAYPDIVESQGKYSRIFSTTDGSGNYINFSVNDSDVVGSVVVRTSPEVYGEYCG